MCRRPSPPGTGRVPRYQVDAACPPTAPGPHPDAGPSGTIGDGGSTLSRHVADSHYALRMGDELGLGQRPADWPPPSPVPIPDGCFLNGTDVEYLGFKGQRLWRCRVERRLYTWDAVHGHVEVFNLRGRHLAVLDAFTGAIIGEAVPGRRIDV